MRSPYIHKGHRTLFTKSKLKSIRILKIIQIGMRSRMPALRRTPSVILNVEVISCCVIDSMNDPAMATS